MNRTDRQIMADYARDRAALRPMPRWQTLALSTAAVAVFAGIGWISGDILSTDSYPPPAYSAVCYDAQDDANIPPCPSAAYVMPMPCLEYTEWCGCAPPVYGDDC